MEDILAAGSIMVLEQYALSKVVVGLDFDGTLPTIVDNRRLAAMRTSTRNLLRTLAELYPCAVISGRARADVETRLDSVSCLAVIGNHGRIELRRPGFRGRETDVMLRQISRAIERFVFIDALTQRMDR